MFPLIIRGEGARGTPDIVYDENFAHYEAPAWTDFLLSASLNLNAIIIKNKPGKY